MPDINRSITFTLYGQDSDLRITVVEKDDGTLQFDYVVDGGSELRGLFFDFNNTALINSLEVDGPQITNQAFEDEGVTVLNDGGTRVRAGDDFDAGMTFRTSEKEKDTISQGSFVLSSNTHTALTLNDIAGVDFSAQFFQGSHTAAIAPPAAAADANDSRGATFTMYGRNSDVVIKVVEGDDGTLHFDYAVDGDGELQGLFFNINNAALIDTLEAEGSRIDNQAFENGGVVNMGGGVSMKSSRSEFDAGITFLASTGKGQDQGSFVLSSSDGKALTMDDIANVQFGSKLSDSIRSVVAIAPAAPDANADEIITDEDSASDESTAPNANLLDNDTDGDGDALTVVAIDGDAALVGTQFQLPSGALITVNSDGSYDVDPNGVYEFLEEGEERVESFTYQVSDNIADTDNQSTDTATATVTITGVYDAPVETTGDLLFVTENQSMFATGSAIVFDDPLPFFGIDEYASLTTTFFGSQSFLVADTPSIGTSGSLDFKAGVQPYFELTTGDVDATIPVGVVFTAPYQVEAGDVFTIGSAYSVDGANFQTASPNVSFGLDFVFDLDVNLSLKIGESTFGGASTVPLFDVDSARWDGFTGEQGEPGFNIFDFSAEDDLEYEWELGDYGTFAINFPVINTDSDDEPNPSSAVVTSSGEDDIAVLDIDIDALLSEIPYVPPFGDKGEGGLSIDVGVGTVNLLGYEYEWNVVALNLINTLKVVQDFTLTIDELPLVAIFEDGSTISDLSVGDDITVTAPVDSDFDPDVDGDADGLLDFMIDVDMGAIFDNLSTLGFDLEIFLGLISLTGSLTSDLLPDFLLGSFSLTDYINPFGSDDDFIWSDTFTLVDNYTLATLFDDDFALIGFEDNPATVDQVIGAYDIA